MHNYFSQSESVFFGVLKNFHDETVLLSSQHMFWLFSLNLKYLSFIRVIIFAVTPIITPFNNIKPTTSIIDIDYTI